MIVDIKHYAYLAADRQIGHPTLQTLLSHGAHAPSLRSIHANIATATDENEADEEWLEITTDDHMQFILYPRWERAASGDPLDDLGWLIGVHDSGPPSELALPWPLENVLAYFENGVYNEDWRHEGDAEDDLTPCGAAANFLHEPFDFGNPGIGYCHGCVAIVHNLTRYEPELVLPSFTPVPRSRLSPLAAGVTYRRRLRRPSLPSTITARAVV